MYETYKFCCPYCGGRQLDSRLRMESVGLNITPTMYVGGIELATTYEEIEIDHDTSEILYLTCAHCDHEWDDLDDLVNDYAVKNDNDAPVDARGNIKL